MGEVAILSIFTACGQRLKTSLCESTANYIPSPPQPVAYVGGFYLE